MDMLSEKYDFIKQANEEMKAFFSSEEEYDAYWAMRKEEHDRASLLSTGREEGREEGRAERDVAIAKSMKENNYPVSEIAKILNLSEDFINEL